MNLTILCGYPNSPYARDILRALNARGVRQVNVVAGSGCASPKTIKQVWASHGLGLPLVALQWGGRRCADGMKCIAKTKPESSHTLKSVVQAQGGQFVCVEDVNGADCKQVLEQQQVDLMILGGAPIVRAHILKVPRVGTLNAHQGALPRFRGMNVIEWALLEGAVPTISVHFVDPGVDTGDIVAMEPIPLQPGDRLSSLRTRSGQLQSELLARMASLATQGPLPRRPQRLEDGRQYYAMHPRLKSVAEESLQALLHRCARP